MNAERVNKEWRGVRVHQRYYPAVWTLYVEGNAPRHLSGGRTRVGRPSLSNTDNLYSITLMHAGAE
jgi:hypothetical protein